MNFKKMEVKHVLNSSLTTKNTIVKKLIFFTKYYNCQNMTRIYNHLQIDSYHLNCGQRNGDESIFNTQFMILDINFHIICNMTQHHSKKYSHNWETKWLKNILDMRHSLVGISTLKNQYKEDKTRA